jgi:hypothetical protein
MVLKFTQKKFLIQFWYKSLFFYILICGLRKERERGHRILVIEREKNIIGFDFNH